MEESSSIAKARRVSSYRIAFDFVSWSHASTALRFLSKSGIIKKKVRRENIIQIYKNISPSRAERFEREREGGSIMGCASSKATPMISTTTTTTSKGGGSSLKKKRRRLRAQQNASGWALRPIPIRRRRRRRRRRKTVAAETTSVPARLTRWIRS